MTAKRLVAQTGQWFLLAVLCVISGCEYRVVEDNREDAAPLSDDIDAVTLDGDALLAPDAPLLTMRVLSGAFEFNWQVSNNVDLGEITSQAIYHFDDRNNTENRVDAQVLNSDTTLTLDIKPHQIHWDSSSYRIETCYVSTCLSSRRIAIAGMLGSTVSALAPASQNARSSFGHDVAVNTNGNVSVTAIPNRAMALVHFYVDNPQLANQWVEANYLYPSALQGSQLLNMKVAISASGDTIAIFGVTNNSSPQISVFDRLGESWVETASFNVNSTSAGINNWLADSLSMHIAHDGDSLMVGVKPAGLNTNSIDTTLARNTLHFYARETFGWNAGHALTVPAQFERLSAFTASDNLNQVMTLANDNGLLRIQSYHYTTAGWETHFAQSTDQVLPSDDMLIAANSNATEFVLAAWEINSNAQPTPVAWRYAFQATSNLLSLQVTDSVRLPPVNDNYAKLRLAVDAKLDTLAVGWQGLNASNLSLFNTHENRWHFNVSLPAALDVSSAVAMIQSIALSGNNSTLLIGVPAAASGGLLTVFK